MDEVIIQVLVRGATWLAGGLAAYIVSHFSFIDPETASKLSWGVMTFSIGWTCKHIGDTKWFKDLMGMAGGTGDEIIAMLHSPEAQRALQVAAQKALVAHTGEASKIAPPALPPFVVAQPPADPLKPPVS